MRLRFLAEEIGLLRGAELVHGEALSHQPRGVALRDALTLMRAVQKIAASGAGHAVVLGEDETAALLAAVRFSAQHLDRYHDHVMGWRGGEPLQPAQVALLERAFPAGKGSAFETGRLLRALRALSARLEAPLQGERPKSEGHGQEG